MPMMCRWDDPPGTGPLETHEQTQFVSRTTTKVNRYRLIHAMKLDRSVLLIENQANLTSQTQRSLKIRNFLAARSNQLSRFETAALTQ